MSLAVAVVVGFVGCGAPPERPDILLVVIDTLRADHVGEYGYARPTTPTLDRLASEGVFFEHAFSTSSWTKPSIGSLLTSRIPSEHGAGFMAEACWPVVAEACAIAAGVTVSWAPFGWTEIKVLVARRFQLSDTPQV